MIELSIRSRLTLWYALVLLAGFSIFGFGMWFALKQRMLAGLDARLAQRMQGVRVSLGARADIRSRAQLQQELTEFATEIPDGTLLQLRDHAGAVLLPQGRQPFAPAADRFRTLTAQMESAGETWSVLVAAPLDEVSAVMSDFRRLLLLLIPVVLAVACAGGYWLSVRALRPVDEITAVARSISVQSLSKRIVVPRTGDELQRMADAWNEVLDRLESAVARIRHFTADASHELRTPLALIRANAELALRNPRDPEEYRRSLRDIQAQAELMTTLTESMLAIARADFEGFDMPVEPTDLNQLVAAEVEQNQARANEKGVRLSAAPGAAAAIVKANPDGVRRLVRILIDNAVRHTPPGGAVTVATEYGEEGAVLSVADTGEGIAEADLPHVFERFYRADAVRGSGSGFGLGLAIAQAIAQVHGSTIAVESTPGAGSRFWLALKT